MKKKVLLILVVAALVLTAVAGAILILRNYGIKIPFLSLPAAKKLTEGLGAAAFEKSKNPLKNELPDNPFEIKIDPFEEGTNAIEKSYTNPLK